MIDRNLLVLLGIGIIGIVSGLLLLVSSLIYKDTDQTGRRSSLPVRVCGVVDLFSGIVLILPWYFQRIKIFRVTYDNWLFVLIGVGAITCGGLGINVLYVKRKFFKKGD